jgi:hypothetical protein
MLNPFIRVIFDSFAESRLRDHLADVLVNESFAVQSWGYQSCPFPLSCGCSKSSLAVRLPLHIPACPYSVTFLLCFDDLDVCVLLPAKPAE